MAIHDVRFLIGLVGTVASLLVWGGATFRDIPNVKVAGWALVYAFMFGLAMVTD